MLHGIVFHNPYFLFGLILIPILIVWYIFHRKKIEPSIQFSNVTLFKGVKRTFRQKIYPSLFILRMLVLTLCIIALARPQAKLSKKEVNIEGIDIMLALDISSSMLAEDFKPNRLEAAKEVALKFIEGRPNDRIGLVVFAGEAFTQCPLTIDHDVLSQLLKNVRTGIIDDGTALGDGLATAVSRIKDSKAKSKAIILLTDGVNNMGSIDPQSAADIAALYNIRIYTIGAGRIGMAPYPFRTPIGIQYQNVEVQIDEPLLRRIASLSGGSYFRATDKKSLQTIFEDIDKMEKSKVDVTLFEKSKEEFFPWILFALVFLGLEIILRLLYFRTTP